MEIKLSNIQIDINDDITSNKKHIKKKSIVIAISVLLIALVIIFVIIDKKLGIVNKLFNINSFYVITKDNSNYIGVGEILDVELVNSFGKVNQEGVEWFSSNNDIVDISDGKIRGLSIGKVKIYAVNDNKKSSELELECLVKVQDIQLDIENIVLPVRATQKINTTIYPENSTYKDLIWSSSDENVATVVNGIVCAKNAGNCEISVTDITGNIVKKCNVQVINIQSDIIILDDTYVELAKGENYIIS